MVSLITFLFGILVFLQGLSYLYSQTARFIHQDKHTMAKEKTCLRCGGSNLEPGVIQSTGRIHFRATNTKIMTFKTSDISIDANICLDCGTLDLVGDVKKAQSLTGRAKPV